MLLTHCQCLLLWCLIATFSHTQTHALKCWQGESAEDGEEVRCSEAKAKFNGKDVLPACYWLSGLTKDNLDTDLSIVNVEPYGCNTDLLKYVEGVGERKTQQITYHAHVDLLGAEVQVTYRSICALTYFDKQGHKFYLSAVCSICATDNCNRNFATKVCPFKPDVITCGRGKDKQSCDRDVSVCASVLYATQKAPKFFCLKSAVSAEVTEQAELARVCEFAGESIPSKGAQGELLWTNQQSNTWCTHSATVFIDKKNASVCCCRDADCENVSPKLPPAPTTPVCVPASSPQTTTNPTTTTKVPSQPKAETEKEKKKECGNGFLVAFVIVFVLLILVLGAAGVVIFKLRQRLMAAEAKLVQATTEIDKLNGEKKQLCDENDGLKKQVLKVTKDSDKLAGQLKQQKKETETTRAALEFVVGITFPGQNAPGKTIEEKVEYACKDLIKRTNQMIEMGVSAKDRLQCAQAYAASNVANPTKISDEKKKELEDKELMRKVAQKKKERKSKGSKK